MKDDQMSVEKRVARMKMEQFASDLLQLMETPIYKSEHYLSGYWFGRAFDVHQVFSSDGLRWWFVVELISSDEEDVVDQALVASATEATEWLTHAINEESKAIDWRSILIEWDTMIQDLEMGQCLSAK